MKALVVSLGLVVACVAVAPAQEAKPTGEKQQQAEPSPEQLEAMLKKMVGALRAKKTDVVSETLRTLIPGKAAVEAALTKEGFAALGGKIQSYAKETFSAGPKSALEKLGVTEDLRRVKVYSATTEDLQSMEVETVAAREFAGGLRNVANHFKPYQTFYCAHMVPRSAEEDDAQAGTRLQLFYFHEGRFVYLGPVWKFQKAE